MTTQGPKPDDRAGVRGKTGARPAFDLTGTPGCCVIAGCGRLMRAPPDALAFGESFISGLPGTEPLVVTRTSEVRGAPSSRARLAGAGLDLEVNA